jgi:hypothetical protein
VSPKGAARQGAGNSSPAYTDLETIVNIVQILAYPRSIFGKLETILAENQTPGLAAQPTGSARKRTLDANSPSTVTATQNKRARRDDAGAHPHWSKIRKLQHVPHRQNQRRRQSQLTWRMEAVLNLKMTTPMSECLHGVQSEKLNGPRSKVSDGSSISSQRLGVVFSPVRLSRIVLWESTVN